MTTSKLSPISLISSSNFLKSTFAQILTPRTNVSIGMKIAI